MPITIHTLSDKTDTTLTFNFSDIDLPDWLERDLAKRELFVIPSQGYMVARRELTLLTKCDTDNKYNPSANTIINNKKLANDIIDNLEFTDFTGYAK